LTASAQGRWSRARNSPKVGEDTVKILHEGLQLEMYGSKANGLYIARHEGSVYILRRRAEYPDSRSFYRVWHAPTTDQLSQSTCGDLGRCLTKEADARACAEATRTCMLHAPRGRLCEGAGGTLELDGLSAPNGQSKYIRVVTRHEGPRKRIMVSTKSALRVLS
jgi:hypothetical protein